MDDYRALLEHSLNVTRGHGGDHEMSRPEFLADYIFDFTTYDADMGELFARKAVEVCAAINDGKTFDYIKDPDNYRWYLLMVNMPFFAGRLEWGTSVRGAWWDHSAQKLESCGLWREGDQVLSMEFPRSEWMRFIAALVEFAGKDGVKACRWPDCGCHAPQGPGECRARAAGVRGVHPLGAMLRRVLDAYMDQREHRPSELADEAEALLAAGVKASAEAERYASLPAVIVGGEVVPDGVAVDRHQTFSPSDADGGKGHG